MGTLQPPISRGSAGSSGCFSEGTKGHRSAPFLPISPCGPAWEPLAKSGTTTAKARDKYGETDQLVEGGCL